MSDLRLSYELDKLQDLVEERLRLTDVLKIRPSNQDNVKLKRQLNRALETLKDAGNGAAGSTKDVSAIEGWSERYNDILSLLPSDNVELSLYRFEMPAKAVPKIDAISLGNLPKRVRFKDEEPSHVYESNDGQFEPYQDEPHKSSRETAGSPRQLYGQEVSPSKHQQAAGLDFISPGISNQDVFVQQQQQLLEQDSQLEVLAGSVHRSYNLSMDINQEVDEQNDHVLQDLESLVNNSGRNLGRAKRRLAIFERTARENGPCFTIAVLIIILFLLIIIL